MLQCIISQKWHGRRHLTGRIIWDLPKKTECTRTYASRGWCWAYKSRDAEFIFPHEFSGTLYLELFGENHDKSKMHSLSSIPFLRRSSIFSLSSWVEASNSLLIRSHPALKGQTIIPHPWPHMSLSPYMCFGA